ncbi:MAG: DUF167 domain-containing protein [Candidatus Aminicenantes bacterium]|nr:DUF167 domain-containing protein [Candidatus Aminicenantes bacterium]
MLKLIKTREGISLSVLVVPRSSKNEIVGVIEGRLKIKLTAPPVGGAANRELITFLVKKLGIDRSSICLRMGEKQKRKVLEIKGIDEKTILEKLSPWL